MRDVNKVTAARWKDKSTAQQSVSVSPVKSDIFKRSQLVLHPSRMPGRDGKMETERGWSDENKGRGDLAEAGRRGCARGFERWRRWRKGGRG